MLYTYVIFWLSNKGLEKMPTPYYRKLLEQFNKRIFKNRIFAAPDDLLDILARAITFY